MDETITPVRRPEASLSARSDLHLAAAYGVIVIAGLLAAGCSGIAGEGPPDAGPPMARFAYGDKYPDLQMYGLVGTIFPMMNDSSPTVWITGIILARSDGFQPPESLENLNATIRLRSVDDGTVIREDTHVMRTRFDEGLQNNVAWTEVAVEICGEVRTTVGARLVVELEVTRDGTLFLGTDSGLQTVSCGGDPTCTSQCTVSPRQAGTVGPKRADSR